MPRVKDISMVLLLIGITIVFIGLHNIDIAWNMNLVKDWKYDINLNGEVRTSVEIYIGAWRTLFWGLFLMGTAFLTTYFF